MPSQFTDIVTSEAQVRAILGEPAQRVVAKVISRLDEHCRDFIARSPFLTIASADAQGHMDVSPKGDPPGFVHVLDDLTLAIPDRVGNRRADTLTNILQNPHVGLLFLIPGKSETLRVSGMAQIVRDERLRQQLICKGKVPDLAIVVSVQEAFIHCAKCIMRSSLWDREQWPDSAGMASIAAIMIDHGKLSDSLETVEAQVTESYRTRLY